MTTEQLPLEVAGLIRQGRKMQAAREAERQRALAEYEAKSAALLRAVTDEIRAALTEVPPALMECAGLRFTTGEAVRSSGQAEVWIEFPGCWPIQVNVVKRAGVWLVGKEGDTEPYRTGDDRHATLAEAAATARDHWLHKQPVPEGLS